MLMKAWGCWWSVGQLMLMMLSGSGLVVERGAADVHDACGFGAKWGS